MPLSRRYSRHQDRLSTRYSPVRHSTQDRSPFRVRLACVKHAASVRSEPGSNSPVHYPSQSQFDWTIIQFKTKYFLARSFTVQFSKINSCERLAQAMRRHLKRFLFWCQPLFFRCRRSAIQLAVKQRGGKIQEPGCAVNGFFRAIFLFVVFRAKQLK